MPVRTFLARSGAIKNSFSPVPSLGSTEDQLDSLVMYALATLYVFLKKSFSHFVRIFILH